MLQTRVIPCLLLQNKGLVKTVKFSKPKYIGDPINAVKIFNEKEVDELVFLDIEASKKNLPIQYELIQDIAKECFMPFAYGGGIKNLDQIRKLFYLGAEKVIINSAVLDNPTLITEAAKIFGNQSIVASVDVKKGLFGGNKLYSHKNGKTVKQEVFLFIKQLEELGAGEIIINSVDQDGIMKGYDLELVKRVVKSVSVPVVALGGAGEISHFTELIKNTGVSAAAAGSMFVFKGPHKAVLINYPTKKIQATLNTY